MALSSKESWEAKLMELFERHRPNRQHIKQAFKEVQSLNNPSYSKNGRSLLFQAIRLGFTEEAIFLLDSGAHADQDSFMLAAKLENLELLKRLAKSDQVHINGVNTETNYLGEGMIGTALGFACYYKRLFSVTFLLSLPSVNPNIGLNHVTPLCVVLLSSERDHGK